MNRKQYSPITTKRAGLLYGGDYNPEQWSREIWAEDDRLMSLAHWNSTTLGVFSWVTLEPEEGRFELDWLEQVMDIEAAAGRVVGLATPSAASPAWLSKKYPETLRVGSDGVRRKHGNRVNCCWSSPVYREKTRLIAQQLSETFKNHPALAYWHVSNELGGECFCDLCQGAFREWLKRRYGTLDALNHTYWAAFWSHTYTDWEQIEAPGSPHGDTSIIGLTVDWKRFTSDQIVDFFLNEATALRAVTPNVPVTTNLMGTYPGLNAHKIAPHLDFASWDSYPWFSSTPSDLDSWIYNSFSHDLCRSLKDGQPFLLMECTPSSSNWYPVMALKRPNALMLEGLQAIAHGSEGIQYFQWRQGRGSSEQFHGAVVAHNGREDARVFCEVSELGETLEELTGLVGSSLGAEVALVFDWENSWAIESVAAPRTQKRDYIKTVLEHYAPFWDAGIPVDIISPNSDLSTYKLVVAPMLFMAGLSVQERLASYAHNGGTLVTTYWSAVVDENTLAYVGGFPKPLRDALGIWVEEIDALYDGRSNSVVTCHTELFDHGATYRAEGLCERIHAETAEILAHYGSDFYAGEAALTRNCYGSGQAFYVASRNESAFTRDFLQSLARRLDVAACVEGSWSRGVTVQCRQAQEADYLFVLNCSDMEASVTLDERGLKDALDGSLLQGRFVLPAFGSRVFLRELEKVATEPFMARGTSAALSSAATPS